MGIVQRFLEMGPKEIDVRYGDAATIWAPIQEYVGCLEHSISSKLAMQSHDNPKAGRGSSAM